MDFFDQDKRYFGQNLDKSAIFVGDDWKGTPSWSKYEQDFGEIGVDVVYLSRTEGVSSSMLRSEFERIKK